MIGHKINITIIGYSINDAGNCLIVKFDKEIPYKGAKFQHITTSTNKGYSPVKVGEYICENNIVLFQKFDLQGIFLPSW